MFAGPNGSGKTTIKLGLQRPSSWFGIYINPDDLEKSIRDTRVISLGSFGISSSQEELRAFFETSGLLRLHQLESVAERLVLQGDVVDFSGATVDSYIASVLADFMRRKALEEGKSFSFETVMSSPDKTDLLREAQSRGYRTYLYYVATDDPDINVARVKMRMAGGGHSVPEEKIRTRYHRSLALLQDAIRVSSRAFLFDTSGDEPIYIAEVVDGTKIELKVDEVPTWFRPIWNQF